MSYMVTTKLSFRLRMDEERCCLIVFGADYAFLTLVKKAAGSYPSFSQYRNADKGINQQDRMIKSSIVQIFICV